MCIYAVNIELEFAIWLCIFAYITNVCYNMSLSFVQVESIKKISEYVAQLRRVGKGHGMYITTIISHTGPLMKLMFYGLDAPFH